MCHAAGLMASRSQPVWMDVAGLFTVERLLSPGCHRETARVWQHVCLSPKQFAACNQVLGAARIQTVPAAVAKVGVLCVACGGKVCCSCLRVWWIASATPTTICGPGAGILVCIASSQPVTGEGACTANWCVLRLYHTITLRVDVFRSRNYELHAGVADAACRFGDAWYDPSVKPCSWFVQMACQYGGADA